MAHVLIRGGSAQGRLLGRRRHRVLEPQPSRKTALCCGGRADNIKAASVRL
jgi:hypothetical protein